MNTRTRIINELIQKFGSKTYLEIGCQNRDENFNHIQCPEKISVDIDPKAKPDMLMSSDQFFAQNKKQWDFIFIDGDHSYMQSLKDILNSLKVFNHVIAIHDTNPLNEVYTQPGWSGEVYKSIMHLHNNTDFMYETFMEERHGLTVVYNAVREKDGVVFDVNGGYAYFENNKKRILRYE